MDERSLRDDKRAPDLFHGEPCMQFVERLAWRRRHWLAFCLSSLAAGCGGGSGTGEWDTTAAVWDEMTWQ
jgi:hypothetical protein